jgi:hypothetical protein
VTYSDNTLSRTYVIFDPDSSYSLKFERGTRVLCDSGCSSCIIMVPSKLTVAPLHGLPPSPDGETTVGHAYGLVGYLDSERCQGGTFDPPAELVWEYDPSQLPEGASEEDMVFASYDEDSNEWSNLDFVIDPLEHSITARLAIIALLLFSVSWHRQFQR